jgi:serine/threonine-protein kinase RsbW
MMRMTAEPTTRADTEPYAVQMTAAPAALATVRSELSDWLDSAGVRGTPQSDVVLAVDEAVANCIEHSGSGDGDRPPEFSVSACIESRELFITVADNGRWRRPAAVRGVRGRGIALMAAVMSSVDINTSRNGTTVHLRRVL